MALIALASRDRELVRTVRASLDRRWHDLVQARSWEVLPRQLRERPVSALLLDLALLPPVGPVAVRALQRGFPGLPLVALARLKDPRTVFELGQQRIRHLIVMDAEASTLELRRSVVRAGERAAPGLVARWLGGLVDPRGLEVVRASLELTHRCWSADRFARSFGLSRPVLSEHLKGMGLPSVGQLMLWGRLLHAGHWLPDPARSGESVARQLEYANGSVFRRALRSHVGCTPTELAEGGGLGRVLRALIRGQDLPVPGEMSASVA